MGQLTVSREQDISSSVQDISNGCKEDTVTQL